MNAIQIDLSVIFLALLRLALPAAILMLAGTLLQRREKEERTT
jgi:hypothetical protein